MTDKAHQAKVTGSKRIFKFNKKVALCVVGAAAAASLLAAVLYGYIYASTPVHLRKPAYQHYHFRTQVLVDGQAVDFSKPEFQVESGTSQTCSAAVGSIPVDFHDKMGQLTHVHWAGLTGGEFLKYYGWNYIGGSDGILGRRYDAGMIPNSIKIYGKLLPSKPDNANFYVYVGDKDGYKKKSWNDFLKQDLETFFGKKSNIGHSEEVTSSPILDWLLPKASAHGGVMDENPSSKSEEELTRINNVIGNVTIFVQKEEPKEEQIKERFNNLVPLHESTCGD